MKKTFAWLDARHISYQFHDYKKEGIARERLLAWSRTLGWKTLINTRGTTFRKLPLARQTLTTQAEALALMQEFPSLIKRPIIETGSGQILVGFDESILASFLATTPP